MNSEQLWKCVLQDDILRRSCTGIYACDTVPKIITMLPTCYIMNTAPSRSSGDHWIAVYLSDFGRNEFFDSHGRKQSEIAPSLCKLASSKGSYDGWHENNIPLQGPLSNTCGQYCLYYLSERCTGRKMTEIVEDFSCFNDRIENDEYVNEYINSNFDTKLNMYDNRFVNSQISTVSFFVK